MTNLDKIERPEPSFIDRLVQRLLAKGRGSAYSPRLELRMAAVHRERATRAPLEMRRARNRRRNRAARTATPRQPPLTTSCARPPAGRRARACTRQRPTVTRAS